MIDNFELIKSLLSLSKEDNIFFHCIIVQRGKDRNLNTTINTYLIRSVDHLENLKDEIILLCEHYKARAYINVAKKNFEAVNKSMLSMLTNSVCLNNISDLNPVKTLGRCIGKVKSKVPKWIIDVDDISTKDSIMEWLDKYFRSIRPTDVKSYTNFFLYAEIPTVNGVHLITLPFNLLEFSKVFPEVTVLKNNGTLLYYPKSLNDIKTKNKFIRK